MSGPPLLTGALAGGVTSPARAGWGLGRHTHPRCPPARDRVPLGLSESRQPHARLGDAAMLPGYRVGSVTLSLALLALRHSAAAFPLGKLRGSMRTQPLGRGLSTAAAEGGEQPELLPLLRGMNSAHRLLSWDLKSDRSLLRELLLVEGTLSSRTSRAAGGSAGSRSSGSAPLRLLICAHLTPPEKILSQLQPLPQSAWLLAAPAPGKREPGRQSGCGHRCPCG